MTSNKGYSDFISGVAANDALEIPKRLAIGLAQATAQAPPGLQNAKNKGNIELTLPTIVVQRFFNLFISLYFNSNRRQVNNKILLSDRVRINSF